MITVHQKQLGAYSADNVKLVAAQNSSKNDDSDDEEDWQDLDDEYVAPTKPAGDANGSDSTNRRPNLRNDYLADISWELPEDSAGLDVDVLSSLPPHIRKSIIEDARRRERAKSRSNYLPAANNPAMYSQTQLSNFLRHRYVHVHQLLKIIVAISNV